jgi:hypothetical protein
MSHSAAAALTLIALTSGCIGNIGDTGEGPGGSGGPTGGLPEGTTLGAVSDLRRLSRLEYEASLRALFGDAGVSAAATALAGLPDDRGKNEFSSMARGVSSAHVDAHWAVAKQVGAAVGSTPELRARMAPCLADASADDACVDDAIESFGLRVLRRPITEDEHARLRTAFDAGKSQLSFEDGVALLVIALLESPSFLYRVEVGTDPVAGEQDMYVLGDYEIATRLSYLLTGAPPDEELLEEAASGGLGDESRFRAQLQRLAASGGAPPHVLSFFVEWLGMDRIPVPQHSPEFLGSIEPAAAVVEMRAELEKATMHHVFDAQAPFAALVASDVSFPGPMLGQIYGVGPSPDSPLSIDDGRRGGLLTRAAFLSTMSEQTHPILRGVFVMRNLLCDDIQVPAASDELPIEPPAFDPAKTARERWTAKTSEPNCANCHQRINAFGFALEQYDSLGRFRELEPIIDPGTGALLAELPIDPVVDVLLDGETVPVDGGVQLSAALAASDQARACFARKWFRFVHGRREVPEDKTEIETLVTTATEGASMVDTFMAVALTPSFRVRRVQ